VLKLFEVTGYKNFDKTIRLDFSDVRDYQFNTECVRDGLLSRMIVYGKNASGKSNLGHAIFDIVMHLTNKHAERPLLIDKDKEKEDKYILISYLNANSDCKYAEFHYVFTFDGKEVDYVYRKRDAFSILYEKLLIDNQKQFEVDRLNKKNNWTDKSFDHSFPNALSDYEKNAYLTSPLMRYVFDALNTRHAESTLQRFKDFVETMLFFRSLQKSFYSGYIVKEKLPKYESYLVNNPLLEKFKAFLAEADVEEDICTMKSDVEADISTMGSDKERILAVRHGNKKLPFWNVASSGTKDLYMLFYWKCIAPKASLLFIDEFDAYYHFELAEFVVKHLKGLPIPQIILTSHNTNLLTNRLLRPDCCFSLSNGKLEPFVKATSRVLREGHNLENLYKSGEFDI
jgi:AAA15 family ATPase/GTPase